MYCVLAEWIKKKNPSKSKSSQTSSTWRGTWQHRTDEGENTFQHLDQALINRNRERYQKILTYFAPNKAKVYVNERITEFPQLSVQLSQLIKQTISPKTQNLLVICIRDSQLFTKIYALCLIYKVITGKLLLRQELCCPCLVYLGGVMWVALSSEMQNNVTYLSSGYWYLRRECLFCILWSSICWLDAEDSGWSNQNKWFPNVPKLL